MLRVHLGYSDGPIKEVRAAENGRSSEDFHHWLRDLGRLVVRDAWDASNVVPFKKHTHPRLNTTPNFLGHVQRWFKTDGDGVRAISRSAEEAGWVTDRFCGIFVIWSWRWNVLQTNHTSLCRHLGLSCTWVLHFCCCKMRPNALLQRPAETRWRDGQFLFYDATSRFRMYFI